MKNKLKIFFFIILILLYKNNLLSDEFTFNTSEIIVLENGDKLKAINGVEILSTDGIKITGNQFDYYKNENKLIVFGDVNFIDQLNKINASAKKITYFKNINKLILFGNVKLIDKLNEINAHGEEIIYLKNNQHLFIKDKASAIIKNQYFIESKNLNFYREKGIISSKNKTKIKDSLNNILMLDEFEYSNKKNIIKGENIEFLDKDLNRYSLEKSIINLKNNNIAGKDLRIDFNNSLFNNPKNQPRLKGKSFISENSISKISKGTFTTCKKRDGCPPWVMSAKEIKHDKLKKTIYYKDAWLKVYDVPVIYFPKFFHPDPTVKRQSGFLIPTFSDSTSLGASFNIPYFNVISDNKDSTFTPRIYSDNKIILQNEYRQVNKNSKHIADFSFFKSNDKKDKNSKTHFFSNSIFNLDSKFFESSKLEVNLENSSNDTYLKTYKLKSPLIKNETTLQSYLSYEASNEDLYINTYTKVYEDLSKTKNDRYEFIYPYFTLSKNLSTYFNSFGNLQYDFSGFQKKFNTNQYNLSAVNDFHFKSFKSYTNFGLVKNYDILFKNANLTSKNTSEKNNDQHKFLTSVVYSLSLPLKKESDKYNNFFSPILSLRYSPNKTKNIKSTDRRIDINNVYTLDRIGSSDTVESGGSVTIGTEYKIVSKDSNNDLFTLGMAQNFRDKPNEDLPTNSTLGKKASDIFGSMKFNPNQYLDFNYNFSLDENLSNSKYDYLKGTLSINNFVTSFEFLDDENIIDGENYFATTTSYNFDSNNSLTFQRRENKKLDLTEYYNLIYQYKNDCLVAGIEYNKQYYTDADLKPEEKLFFSITIIPFGKTTSPTLNE